MVTQRQRISNIFKGCFVLMAGFFSLCLWSILLVFVTFGNLIRIVFLSLFNRFTNVLLSLKKVK
jgi:hypothetical protein